MLIMLSSIHMIKIVPLAVEYWCSNLSVILYLLQYPLTTSYYPSSNTEHITHCLILVSESYEKHFHSFQTQLLQNINPFIYKWFGFHCHSLHLKQFLVRTEIITITFLIIFYTA